jgi:hypothetical protein
LFTAVNPTAVNPGYDRRITKNLFSTEHYEAMGRMKRRIHQGYHHPRYNNQLDQQRRHRR